MTTTRIHRWTSWVLVLLFGGCGPGRAETDAGPAAGADAAIHIPEGAVLAADNPTLSLALGLGRCVQARLLLLDGSSIPVTPADGLRVESSDHEMVDVPSSATPVSATCEGVVVTGVGEGMTALTLRLDGRADIAPARVSASVLVPDGVSILGSTARVGVGREYCTPSSLGVLVEGRSGDFLIREAINFRVDDPSLVTVNLNEDNRICMTASRAGRTELTITHELGSTTYTGELEVEVLEEWTVLSVLNYEMPVLFSPGGCVDLTEVHVAYSDGGGTGSFERLEMSDPRVSCSAEPPLTLEDGRLCLLDTAELGATLQLSCCVDGTCSPARGIVWSQAETDSLSLTPPGHHSTEDRACTPVRAELNGSGDSLDLTRSGLIAVAGGEETLSELTYEDGELCYLRPSGSTGSVTVYFSVHDMHFIPPGRRMLRRSTDVSAPFELSW